MSKTILKGVSNRAISADVSIADSGTTVMLTGEQGCEAACKSNGQPADAEKEAIRGLAHSKWEAAGCPAGDGFDFWLEAEREVHTERVG